MTKKAKKTERYTTAAGEVIEYATPAPDVRAYLTRVIAAANDPRVSEGELIELVYSKENPVLDATIMPGRGTVTRAVFADPVYQVMHDLLFAKRLQMEAVADASPTPAREGLTVAQAAAELEMSASAVRQAIARGDLEATKVGGRHSINPDSVASYRDRVTRRGPAAAPALRVRMGNQKGRAFRVKVLGTPMRMGAKEKLEGGGYAVLGEVARFDRAVVSMTGKRTHRVFRIAPSEDGSENRFEWGPYSIEGRYTVLEKENDADRASEAWKAVAGNGNSLWRVELVDDRSLWVVAGTTGQATKLAVEAGDAPTGEVTLATRAPKAVRRFFSASARERVLYPDEEVERLQLERALARDRVDQPTISGTAAVSAQQAEGLGVVHAKWRELDRQAREAIARFRGARV